MVSQAVEMGPYQIGSKPYLSDRKINIRNEIDRYKPQDPENDRYRHENTSIQYVDIIRYIIRYDIKLRGQVLWTNPKRIVIYTA